jgi:mevalonate kinase
VIPALDSRNFPAKLLLFGEHVLLLGATALAVPVAAFGGQWAWNQQRDRHHQRLLQFALSEALKSVEIIDTERFVNELEAGLLFQSNIPTGYGLGSSGALCAAIYERFASEKTDDLARLKSIFAQMESFFHGNSSGIDPLTSYVESPILIQNKTEVTRVSPQNWKAGKPTVSC